MFLIAAGMGLRMLGVAPSSEEVLRLIALLALSIVYGAFWLGLAILFSTFFRRVATSVLASIGIWIFFAFFMFMVAGAVANMMVPVDQTTPKEIMWHHEEVRRMVMRASPTTLFEEAVTVLLVPEAKIVAMMMVKQPKYMIPESTLSFGQSLVTVWPHLVGLVALTLVCFAISYVKFLREEIRST
jgi:ABC-2 type transport system permease protein